MVEFIWIINEENVKVFWSNWFENFVNCFFDVCGEEFIVFYGCI